MSLNIRLPKYDLEIIKQAFKHYFSKNDHLWLFGSRVDLTKHGGDLDFYIETIEIDINVAVARQSNFIIELQDQLGDQKIDVVLNCLSNNVTLPIYDIAKQTGVQLL